MNNKSAGLLILRISIGCLMLFHGIHKLIYGHDYIRSLLHEHGLPGILTFGVPIGEVVAPLLMIAGWMTRPGAVLVAFTMVMSIYLEYGIAAFELDQYGGLKTQVNLLFLFGSCAVAFLGAGEYSLSKGHGRWN